MQTVALEVDGPTHFIDVGRGVGESVTAPPSSSMQLNASTLLKRRLLEKEGYRYSVYLLYWNTSTNTDAEGGASGSSAYPTTSGTCSSARRATCGPSFACRSDKKSSGGGA